MGTTSEFLRDPWMILLLANTKLFGLESWKKWLKQWVRAEVSLTADVN